MFIASEMGWKKKLSLINTESIVIECLKNTINQSKNKVSVQFDFVLYIFCLDLNNNKKIHPFCDRWNIKSPNMSIWMHFLFKKYRNQPINWSTTGLTALVSYPPKFFKFIFGQQPTVELWCTHYWLNKY